MPTDGPGDVTDAPPARRRRTALDYARFTLGAGAFIHEVAFTTGERVSVLAAALLLMGYPLFRILDDKLAEFRR